jgi:O-antigen polymerase
LFGVDSLIAYFFYTICVAFLSAVIFSTLLFKWNRRLSFKLPTHIFLFLTLTVFVLFHGVVNKNIGLVHYYWLTNAFFITSIYYWNLNQGEGTVFSKRSNTKFLYAGIIFLAIIESIIVLLQCIQVFPVPSKFFLCTGTWANPNVIAMFLSLSLLSVFKLTPIFVGRLKWLDYMIFSIIIISILALQCRSAYLVTIIILFRQIGFTKIKGYLAINFSINSIFKYCFLFLISLIVISSFISKTESTNNRISIWSNTISFIGTKPVFGYGFGLYEKEYNLYAAKNRIKDTEHINMPYNDFLELGVEGGIFPIIVWAAFLFTFWKKTKNRNFGLTLVLSFLVIQFTNFGFEAIPAMVLFLLYTSLENQDNTEPNLSSKPLLNTVVCSIFIFTSFFYLFFISDKIKSFYTEWLTSSIKTDSKAIKAYSLLSTKLNNYALHHINYGDAFQNQKQFREALNQYLVALNTTSKPDIFLKTAYCYQKINKYDSAEHYYKIVEDIEPRKLIPQFSLLKMYLQTRDTLKVAQQCNRILNTQIKIKTTRAREIKLFADSVNKKWSTINKK